ncbi:MAG: endonuclease V, partial [Planctomycetota bacterium]
YVPGYLSFREVPVFLTIFEKMKENFDILVCDGHGLAHPRRFGLACHIGGLLNKPSIGCAKSRLIRKFNEPPKEKGSFSYLFANGDKIGIALRSRSNIKPVFLSPGHLVNFKDCQSIIMACVNKYRIPEPLRLAHQAVNKYRLKKINGC